jgi:hypothetical protein
MLLAVRNFFRESGPEQSVLDEQVAVRQNGSLAA